MSIKYAIKYTTLEGGGQYVAPENWDFFDDIPVPSAYFTLGKRVVSYSQRNGRDIINYGTINSFIPITNAYKNKNPFKLGITLDSNPNTPLSLPAQNYGGIWNLVDDNNKFNRFPEAKTAYENQQVQQAHEYKRFFITLPIDLNNERVNERVKVCEELGGHLDHPPHFTLYSGLWKIGTIITNPRLDHNLLIEKFLELSNTYDEQVGEETRSYYKFLGRNLPPIIKDMRFNFGMKDEIYDILEKNTSPEELQKKNTVYLARIFFDGKKDFSSLYEYIKYGLQDVVKDTEFYTKADYKEFELHISVGKFENLNSAANALKAIYDARFSSFENFFVRDNFFEIQLS